MSISVSFAVKGSLGADYPNNSQNIGTYISNFFTSPYNGKPFIAEDIQVFAEKMGVSFNFPTINNDYSIARGWQGITLINSNNDIVFEEKVDFDRDNYNWKYTLTINGTTTTKTYAEDDENLIPYFITQSLVVPSDVYTLSYRFQYNYAGNPAWVITASAIIAIVQNRLPLKKWTITAIIVRACDLIEPLRYGQKPRFRLDGVIYDDTTGNATGYRQGSIAEELDKIIAPEYAFTKMHFREQMQQVGGYIHGEFRITGFNTENGKRYYTFTFDKYGGNKKAPIKDLKRPVSSTFKTDINDYCTSLDSSAENIINQLDYAQGVIIEPYNGWDISLRSDTTTARMEEDNNTYIPTNYPLYQAGKEFKVYATWINSQYNAANSPDGKGREITPFIFEKADYDLLSSYEGTYPYCKAYALYYTQGEKNIKGLFFKPEHAVSSIFNNYAIVNILRAVTGDNSLTLSYQELMDLSFTIEYKPIYSERVKTNKQCVIGGTPRTLAYNQTANIIEARHYGEHLKGIVARLGNVEKTLTYNLAFLSDIPKIGTLYDEHYYISAVYSEILPAYIRCTIALSKDFNRLSQYIGINSEKRMWEVSEKMAQKRESIIQDYLLISETAQSADNKTLFRTSDIAEVLFNKELTGAVSAARILTYSKNGDYIVGDSKNITLPVISSALGNSLAFTFKFEDNYSAGQKTLNITGADSVRGKWTNFVPYADYYGRFYWLGFSLEAGTLRGIAPGNNGQDVPAVITAGGTSILTTRGIQRAIKKRKDSREIPQDTVMLTAVTDSEDYIIGSDLMRNCQLVNGNPKNYELCVFTDRLNPINSRIPFDQMRENIDYYKITFDLLSNISGTVINFSGIVIDVAYSAWAITTVISRQDIQVEDEDGEEQTQAIISGGEIVIGKNGQLPEQLHLTVKSDVYN